MQKVKLKLKRLPPSEVISARSNRPRRLRGAACDAALIESDEQSLKALALRKEKKGYQEIADTMGISISTAFTLVNKRWAAIIENAEEFRISIIGDTLTEVDDMLNQLKPYVFNKEVTVMGFNARGQIVKLEHWQAMTAAIKEMTKLLDLRAKVAGIVKPQQASGEGMGEKTLGDLALAGVLKYFMDNTTKEKTAQVKEIAA